MTSAVGYYDLTDEDDLQALVSDVDSAGDRVGVLPDYGLRYCRSVTPHGERIAFADMSSEQATLSNLIKTCLLIGALCFAVFLLISWLLARWAVKPVARNLKKAGVSIDVISQSSGLTVDEIEKL